jgi:hypothetical protein
LAAESVAITAAAKKKVFMLLGSPEARVWKLTGRLSKLESENGRAGPPMKRGALRRRSGLVGLR